MTQIAGLPYKRLNFTLDDGKVKSPPAPALPAGITDLIVVSHGWHMDADASEALYQTLIGNLVQVDAGRWDAKARNVAVWGVFWPSDRFRDDLGAETQQVVGGAAASAGGELHREVLKAQARQIADFLGIKDPEFEKLVVRATASEPDADELADVLRQAVGLNDADEQTALDHKELAEPGSRIVANLSRALTPASPAASAGGGGAPGQAAGFFSGASAGVAKMLNQFAYFELKKRAGAVGESLGALLDAAAGLDMVRIHLVGHSFGARLVTAAAAKMTRSPQSMTLLQGAFSHNSFAEKISYGLLYKNIVGGYRKVISGKKINGPIAISHTWNDEAVGLAYPSASRVSQTVANAIVKVSAKFGGAKDVFGGLGANGARGLPKAEGTDIVYDGVSALTLKPGHVTNLQCDFITGHNDVGRIEAARVLHAAME
ncbi:hypothetical protein GVN21_10360 [Caulobacter sp. SLTY]|uniref:hypothetical protein n=1 Tax=Caulobacter sp. SLTY TaxID=2683262 RepID=UPI0014127DED|nr:hypothetical protein [Caulobacter sp. SLTY]NBB15757.1 hypothetical protein [Caulobacter sp. SLTY]